MTDPVADMFTRIRNAYPVRKNQIQLPYSQIKHAVAKIMVKAGYLQAAKQQKEKNSRFKTLQLTLKYSDKQPALTMIRRISKPGRRVYCQAKDLKTVNYGLGISIVSTSSGLMTNNQARKKGLGGEIICEMW